MAIEQEVETIKPEIENSDVTYIQNLSGRLLKEVDFFLQDRPSIPLNLSDVEAKLKRYEDGNFQMTEIDFTCLERMLNFLIDRHKRSDLEVDRTHLAEIRARLNEN